MGARTLSSVLYSWMILGWKMSGRESCVSGDGSMVCLVQCKARASNAEA